MKESNVNEIDQSLKNNSFIKNKAIRNIELHQEKLRAEEERVKQRIMQDIKNRAENERLRNIYTNEYLVKCSLLNQGAMGLEEWIAEAKREAASMTW